MRSYEEFKSAIRARESSNRYDCVNRFGFLGAYQFGMARLCDLGITRRTAHFPKQTFEFVPPRTAESFLADERLQDECFDRHVADLKRRLELAYTGTNLSGAIAACHLMGYQAFLDYFHRGEDRRDGLGTAISDYFSLFEGYEIP